jgi:hypothetical protein
MWNGFVGEALQGETMQRTAIAFALCLWSVSAIMLSPAMAEGDTKEILAQDFRAFYDRCPGAPASYSQSCANELAALSRRQHDLHLSDEDLSAAVGSRGGFRGGFR